MTDSEFDRLWNHDSLFMVFRVILCGLGCLVWTVAVIFIVAIVALLRWLL